MRSNVRETSPFNLKFSAVLTIHNVDTSTKFDRLPISRSFVIRPTSLRIGTHAHTYIHTYIHTHTHPFLPGHSTRYGGSEYIYDLRIREIRFLVRLQGLRYAALR